MLFAQTNNQMYINYSKISCACEHRIHKTILIMKLTFLLLITGLLQVNASSFAQKITLQKKGVSLGEVFKEIRKQTTYDVLLYADNVKSDMVVDADFNKTPLNEVMKKMLTGKDLIYTIEGKTIIIKSRKNMLAADVPPVEIRGKVTDEEGIPLPGVSVQIKNTNKGVITDVSGWFAIDVSKGQTLVFTYIGFGTREIQVGDETMLNVTLKINPTQLQEVVVSYGKQVRREITGSIATVNAEELQDMPVLQIAQQLQGKVAGVQIAQSSGQPGRGVQFRIRGSASLFAGNQPLFVVDGMPVTGSVNNINPNEIESFSILKDASASSLYGSRAANGVILITTKHAKAGDSKIVFNANYGLQKIPGQRLPQSMNATEFAQFMKERFEDKAKYEGYTGGIPAEYQNPEQYGVGTNWFNVLTQTAPIQSYDLTVQSAGEKSSSTVIAGYQEQEGVIINTGTKLFSLRLNQSLSLSNNKLKLGFNVAPSYRLDHNNRLATDGANALWGHIVEASPLFSPVNPDGSMPKYVSSPGMVNYLNPYAQFTSTIDDYKTTRILGNAYLDYEVLNGLRIKTNLGIDKGAESGTSFNPSFVTTNDIATGQSNSVDNYSWTAEANLQYNRTFFNDHHLEALVGYSAQKFEAIGNSVSGTGFPSDDVPYIRAATVISGGNATTTQYSLLSTIARLNYNYKGKYLLAGAIRRDGSSKFGADRRFGNFPSVSAAWVISDEGFMAKSKKIDLLKIRTSYGVTGNNAFGNFVSIATLGEFNYLLNGVLVPGTTINSLGNSELAWERNKQFDVGLELNMLNNRLSFTYDYYHKISDGLIQDRPIPQASGFSTIKFNVGVFEFWGHELSLSSTNLTGKVKWNSNLNISFDRNLIKSLVDPGFIRRNNTIYSDFYRQQAGHHLGEFYGFVFEGLYKDAEDLANSPKYKGSDVGTIKMRDINEDGVIEDVGDRTFIGDPTPDFNFGITNNLTYKKFDLSITMAGSVGGQIMNFAKWAYSANLDGSRVPIKAVADRWRSPENPGSGVYPRTKTGTTALGRAINTQMLENGSYLTAKNISLGYTFNLKNNLMLKNFRVYGSVHQAFTITGYSGLNPEINSNGLDATAGIGVDENAYPIARTFSIGLSTTFK